MPGKTIEEQLKAYRADSRYACQFGLKCYQKNPAHHAKYKHPPKMEQGDSKDEKKIVTGKKRSSSECVEDDADVSNPRETKLRKDDEATGDAGTHSLSPSPPPIIEDSSDSEIDDDTPESSPRADSSSKKKNSPRKDSSEKNSTRKEDSSPAKESSSSRESLERSLSPKRDSKTSVEDQSSTSGSPESSVARGKQMDESDDAGQAATSSSDPKQIISDIFLVTMPTNFYEFYKFCKSVNPKDPTNALKLVDLRLVGPYDVLNGNIKTNRPKEPEKYLRHWRYYYDPPEFQTILKGNDKDGLHYGYWRDVVEEEPVFVAKNSANKDCIITPVAPNIFAAVNSHIEESVKTATPFQKGPMLNLSKQLKAFAKDNGIDLQKDNSEMRNRSRKVVAKTLHTAGIVVPYDKKTQLGYRDLAATDSQIKRILTQIEEAESDDERKRPMSKIEEIVRLATIAADEYDFGTCLELGHDLFSSGCSYVQRTGLRVLASAYNLLKRQKFLKIAEAHAADRKKGCDLGVL